MEPKSPTPRALLAALAGLALASALVLAWVGVLPGGWRMRGWLEPHADAARTRRARASHEALERFARENRGAPPGAIAFLGSSTIARFPLAELFPGAPCLDRGVGEEPAAELARRLAASLPAAPIAGAVVFTGRVEHLEGAGPAEVAGAVEEVLDALERAAPQARVLLLGLLPERAPDAAASERLARTNRALAALAARRGVDFLPTDRPPLALGPPGSARLSPELSDDRYHLSEAGYRVLARWIVERGGAVGRLLAPAARR